MTLCITFWPFRSLVFSKPLLEPANSDGASSARGLLACFLASSGSYLPGSAAGNTTSYACGDSLTPRPWDNLQKD